MEFSDLGKHCAKCNYIDYLPFLCTQCNKYYCLEHRSYDEHECKNKPKQTKLKEKDLVIPKNKCGYKKCKNNSIFQFYCSECKKKYCTNHRHHIDHK